MKLLLSRKHGTGWSTAAENVKLATDAELIKMREENDPEWDVVWDNKSKLTESQELIKKNFIKRVWEVGAGSSWLPMSTIPDIEVVETDARCPMITEYDGFEDVIELEDNQFVLAKCTRA